MCTTSRLLVAFDCIGDQFSPEECQPGAVEAEHDCNHYNVLVTSIPHELSMFRRVVTLAKSTLIYHVIDYDCEYHYV